MASLTTRKNGSRAIQFIDADGNRKTIHLGKIDKRQAESIKGYIEKLADAVLAGHAPDRATTAWLQDIGDRLREKLIKAGLAKPSEVEPDAQPEPVETLGSFLVRYIDGRTDIKPRSRDILQRAADSLTEFFGADRPLDSITVEHAAEWERWLAAKGSKEGGPLATNTVRDRVKKAKQLFSAAMDYDLIATNPLRKLKGTMVENKTRDYEISKADAEKVIAACPDLEWRVIFTLSRYGGLRCPSEHLALKWEDILWDIGRMHVRSPKTEHHDGHESRVVPLFPDLRPHLAAAFEAAADGTEFVITRYRSSNANLRTQLIRIIKRAGLTPWPKLFHNLRATRQTELTDWFPQHVVCAWLGNSESVARRHYLSVTEDHFEKALHYALQNMQEQGGMEGNQQIADGEKCREIPPIPIRSTPCSAQRYTPQDSNLKPPVP